MRARAQKEDYFMGTYISADSFERFVAVGLVSKTFI